MTTIDMRSVQLSQQDVTALEEVYVLVITEHYTNHGISCEKLTHTLP